MVRRPSRVCLLRWPQGSRRGGERPIPRVFNTEFVAHPKHSTCKHASKVARFGVGGHQAITQHVAQSVQVVGNGVNVGERFGDRRNCWADTSTPRSCNFAKKVDQGITVNTGFNVMMPFRRDISPSKRLRSSSGHWSVTVSKPDNSLSHATVSG